jgi:hypothetical protein
VQNRCRVFGAGLVQIRRALSGGQSPGGAENRQLAFEGLVHGPDRIFNNSMRNTNLKRRK